MKFLADMAISQTTVAWLRECGHDVVHVRDVGMQRADDAVILIKAREEARVLLTLDLDFGYLLAISKAVLPSVVIFRMGNETAEAVTQRLAEVLAHCESDLRTGAIVTVNDEAIRVRLLPITRD